MVSPQPQIVALRGPLAGRSYPLSNAPLSFGRTPDNAVVITSGLASRRHAEVRFEAGFYLLCDLGSSNGTLVNGQRIQVHRLNPGDLFEIGDEAFRFELPAAYDKTLPVTPPLQRPSPLPQQPPPPLQQPSPLPQQPLPQLQQPLPQGRSFDLIGSIPQTPSAAPPQRRRRCLPIFLMIVGVMACLLVGLVGGGAALIRYLNLDLDELLGPTSVSGEINVPTAGPAPTRAPVTADAAAWTILVYLDGDNNLEPDAIDDIREMAAVGSSDQLKIVVQLDRISSPEQWDDRSAGDWDGTKRFLVERGMEPTPDAALDDLGELNMGDPAVLADFIDWGVTTFPAERYALIIWDHGASWLGVASDDTDDDIISMPELSSALETARARSNYGRFDLIGFDACLMAQLDVFQTVAPYADLIVASAELEPSQGWAWDAWLGALAADLGQEPSQLAEAIVTTYIASYEGSDSQDVTLSAFDLTRIDEINRSLDDLAGTMIDQLGGPGYTAVAQSRSYTDVYAPTNAEEFNAVDLGHFAQLLTERSGSGPMAEAAATLERAITATRIANGAGSYHTNTSGVSIYFPQTSELYVEAYERASPLPSISRWDEFLTSFHTAGTTEVTKPTISNLRLSAPTVSINSPVTLEGNISGQDIAYVFSFIGIASPDRTTVDLIYVDFIYPPDEIVVPGDQPRWSDGEYTLNLTWDATNWYLSNGRESIEVLLGPIKYGTEFYGVEGVYISQATGERTDAGLVFTVRDGQATLERVWGFPRSRDRQEPQPYELIPIPGDSFSAYLRSYTDTNGTLQPGRVEGQTITFGDQPLFAGYGPTVNGDYVMGFLVRDIAGNFSYDYVDITVANP